MRDDDADGPGRQIPAMLKEQVDPTSVEGLARAAILRLATETAERGAVVPLSEAEVDGFCALLVAGDFAAAEAMMRRLTTLRPDYAQIADGLLSLAARRLGRGWEEDSLSFADMSVAISQIFRLNQMFRQRHVPLSRPKGRLALFATLPGQHHNLGLVLAAEAFRRHGWEVDLRLDTAPAEIVALAKRLRPNLVGLTTSRETRNAQLAHLIAELRRLPKPMRIMLGGGEAQHLADSLPKSHIDRVVIDIASALAEI
jgi:methanogenic corrinoid protein MtbC1